MRPSKNDLIYTKQTKKKKLYRSPICKKYKTRRKWYTVHNPSDVHYDTLHKDFYSKKSERTDDTKHWKVMPKDSCEVYRARRKRQQTEMSARPNEDIEEKQITNQNEENLPHSTRHAAKNNSSSQISQI